MEHYNHSIKNTNKQGGQRVSFNLITSYGLWHYLVGRRALSNQPNGTKHRFTKAEAFFDLLDRQRKSMSTNDDGYMDSSVMKLANCWGWMRPTVKKFLDKLASMGVITQTPAGNRIVVRLNNIMGQSMQMPQRVDDGKSKVDDTLSTTPQGDATRQKPDSKPGTFP